MWREGDGARAKPSVEEEVVEDGSPRGIWSGIFGPGKPRDVGTAREGAGPRCSPAQDRDQARVEAETETETEAEAEAEAEAETEAAVSPAEREAVPETTSVDVEPALETACVVAEVDAPPPATDSDVPAVQKTWDEFEVTLDCTAGVNMTGLQFAQREDGLLRVSVCKPGGTASKKVKINARAPRHHVRRHGARSLGRAPRGDPSARMDGRGERGALVQHATGGDDDTRRR